MIKSSSIEGIRVVVKFTFKEACQVIWQAFPSLALIIVIIGGIIAGIYTATEAACAAVVYALILSVIYKQIDLKTLKFIAKDTIEISSLVLFLIGASSAMSYVLAYTQLPKLISDTILGITTNEIIILLIINVVLLIVGMFMDLTPALLDLHPDLPAYRYCYRYASGPFRYHDHVQSLRRYYDASCRQCIIRRMQHQRCFN